MRSYQFLLLVLVLTLLAAGMWQFYVATIRESPSTEAERLWQAVGEMDVATVQAILKASPKYIGGTDEHGRTLLHHAVRQGRDDKDAQLMVGLLIEWNADLEASDQQGQRPLHVAAKFGLPNLTRTLLAARADVDAKDTNGLTPLALAEEFRFDQFSDIGSDDRLKDRRRDVAELLREHKKR